MPLCDWNTFWMVPYLIFYFIEYYFRKSEKKWLLIRNLNTSQSCMENVSVLML